MTKVVKADRPEFVFLQKGLEVLRNKIGLIGYAQVIDVDVVAFSVAVSAQLSALFLAGFYPEFLFHSKRAVQVEQLEGDPSWNLDLATVIDWLAVEFIESVAHIHQVLIGFLRG